MRLDELAKRYHRELAKEWGGGLNDYFGLACLERTFGLSRDEARQRLLFAQESLGLGGVHYSTENRTLYLFVFLCDDNPQGFQQPLRLLADGGLSKIFADGIDSDGGLPLQQLRSCIFEYRYSIQQVLLRCIFAGDEEELKRSELVKKLTEDISSKRYILDDVFGHPVNLVIDWRSAQDMPAMVHRADKTHAHKFGLTDVVKREGPGGETILLGFVPLVHVLKCYREMESRFLERNIRFGLGNRKYVNQVLRSAFRAAVSQGEDAASLFVFHHNGITLAAENVEKSDGEVVLTEPRLLNGAQTITTFREFSDELEAKAQTEAVSNALEKLMVPCKIIVGCKADFVTAVTINNNRQTPVEPWQLRANDEIQISLQDKFRRDLGLYYERQAGAFQALDEKTRRDLGLTESKRAIELRKLAQTFLVAEGRLSRANHLREVFQQDEQYRQVFHEGRLEADSKSIVLCYKTHFRLHQMGRMLAEEARKYEFAPKVRPLIWALLCQAFLNAENLESLQEKFGCDLVVQDEFVDTLRDLGRKLVKPLISDVLAEIGRPVSPDVEGAEFVRNLNSDQTFRKCMNYAEARWGWRTRKLE